MAVERLQKPMSLRSSVVRGEMLAGVDVDLVFDRGDRDRHRLGADAQQIGAARQQRLLVHPQKMRGELIGDLGARARARPERRRGRCRVRRRASASPRRRPALPRARRHRSRSRRCATCARKRRPQWHRPCGCGPMRQCRHSRGNRGWAG